MKFAAQLYIHYINPSILTSSKYKIDWQRTFHLYHLPSEFDIHPKRRQAPQENDKTITRSPPVLVYPLQVRINPFSNIYMLMKFQDGPIQFIPNKFIYIFGNAKKICGIVICFLSIKGAIYTIHLNTFPSERYLCTALSL